MAVSVKQGRVGALVPTATTGIYRRLKSDGKTTFYVRFTRPDGRRSYEAAGTFEGAKARLAEVSGKLHKGEVVGDASTTLASVIADWKAIRNVKPRTRETQDAHVRLYIEPYFRRVKVRDLTRGSILKWLGSLKRHDGRGEALSDGTKAVVLATLSSVLDLAVDDNLIAANPVKALGRKQKPRQGKIEDRILGPGELEALLGACERFAWLRPVIQTTLLAALRLGEVCGLDWRDVDFERKVLIVRQQLGKDGRLGTPKGSKVKEIPLLPDLIRILAGHKLASKNTGPGDPVFTNKIGGRRHPHEVARAFRKARACARLSTEPRAFRFHDLRHTAITTLANQPGAVLTQVQAFARHSNLQTTFEYVHKVEDATWTEQAGAALAGIL